MNEFIKQVIEEKFASKKQQRLFYAKAGDKSLPKKERKNWKKWSKEFSDDTDFKHLPEKVKKTKKKDVDEIVDEDGNIETDSYPTDLPTKGVTSNSTSDEVVRTAMGQMGAFGIGGPINTSRTLKYWAESDMSKALGYQDTLGKDEDFEDAEEHFTDELGLPDDEAKDRLEKMGYDEKLPNEKIRLIENPKKFVEEYIESLLMKKSKENDVLEKDVQKEVNPIIKKQIEALKQTLKNNSLSVNDIINDLKDE